MQKTNIIYNQLQLSACIPHTSGQCSPQMDNYKNGSNYCCWCHNIDASSFPWQQPHTKMLLLIAVQHHT